MEKNAFLLYNDIVSALYTCREPSDLKTQFLPRLNALIPFSYASICLADTKKHPEKVGILELLPPLCVPESFAAAETEWINSQEEDYLSWLALSTESILVRESDVLDDEQRLNSYIYKKCYRQYNIYDTLQYAIVNDKKFLGIVTLLRTKIDDAFGDDDTFFFRSMGVHLTEVLKRFTYPETDTANDRTAALEHLRKEYSLTARETQVLGMVSAFTDNEQICTELCIKENTLQKHLQNIFRKLGVSSRWEAAAMCYK